jgi:hypothetical protein
VRAVVEALGDLVFGEVVGHQLLEACSECVALIVTVAAWSGFTNAHAG